LISRADAATGSYEATARKPRIDRRTVRAKVEFEADSSAARGPGLAQSLRP
jgi:hypothetical protein